MRLPNTKRAVIDPRKLRDYVLSPVHPLGRFKAVVFRALGYTPRRWRALERALRVQHLSKNARLGLKDDYGQRYEIRAKLRGPNRRSGTFVSAWIVRAGEDFPRLLTVYPED